MTRIFAKCGSTISSAPAYLGFQSLVHENDKCQLKQMLALMQKRFYIVNHLYQPRRWALISYLEPEEPSNKRVPLKKC
jgi:hypothetical protein